MCIYTVMRTISLLALAALTLSPLQTRAGKAFDVKKHLGNLSPFFTPPPVPVGLVGGLGTGMPEGCVLEQLRVLYTALHICCR